MGTMYMFVDGWREVDESTAFIRARGALQHCVSDQLQDTTVASNEELRRGIVAALNAIADGDLSAGECALLASAAADAVGCLDLDGVNDASAVRDSAPVVSIDRIRGKVRAAKRRKLTRERKP